MAEAAISGENGPEWVDQTDVKPKMLTMRQPNKKKHEEELDVLNMAIRGKEANIKSLNLRTDDSIQSELRTIRIEKDSTIGRRKQIDTELRSINHAITKQMAELTKVQSNLQYRNEDKINSAIGNLEYQLKMQNFRLSEEKKIVAEIDSLKRSKKALGNYIELKREIDGMRDRQYRMRQERDQLYKVVTSMKLKEDDIRKTAQKGKAKADELKRDMDELYAKRKALVGEYKMQEKEFQSFQKEIRLRQREEFLRRKEEEARTRQEQFMKDMVEYEASREPYEDEKLLCNALISYLQRYMSNINGLVESDLSQVSVEPQTSQQEVTKDLNVEGMYVLRKKSEENDMYSVKPKMKKKNSRERKKSANKPLSHTPKTLDQFEQLDLVAPSVVTEVAQSIAQLEEKRMYYEDLLPPNQPLVHIDIVTTLASTTLDQGGASDQDGSAGAPSFTESAISESIPSTPEVSLDNQPPRFPRDDSSPSGEHRQRKLSRDSGACELEGQTSCDEQIQLEEPQSPPGLTVPRGREELGAQGASLVDLTQATQEETGFIMHTADFFTDFPIMKSSIQSICDEDAGNDSETICNSTDNSNEADLDNVEDIELLVSHEEVLTGSKLQVETPGVTIGISTPGFDKQENLLSEAAGADNTLDSS